jgi:hypothetical protein
MRWRIAAVALAAAAALLPIPSALVERVYSTRAYPWWQRQVTPLSNAVPFALFDLLVIAIAATWLVLAIVQVRRRRTRALVPIAARTVVWAAVAYLVFLAAWGLNYRRTRLVDRLAFDATRVSVDAARVLARAVVAGANREYAAAHAVGAPPLGRVDAGLAAAFESAARDLGGPDRVAPGRPKTTWFDWYFRRAGVDGMTDPFFLETLVPSDLTTFERPIVVAHEWAHLAGYADEGEANFVGWLACTRGGAADRYAAWLFLYEQVVARLPRTDPAAFAAELDEGPRADLRAIAARLQRNVSPRVAAAGWQVYNEYLKSNRVEAGVSSYGEMVRLVLGTRFNPAPVEGASRQ